MPPNLDSILSPFKGSLRNSGLLVQSAQCLVPNDRDLHLSSSVFSWAYPIVTSWYYVWGSVSWESVLQPPTPIQTTHMSGYCQCCWDTTRTRMSLRAEASKCQLLPCLHFLPIACISSLCPPFTGVCLTSGCGSIFVSLFGNFYESGTTLNPVSTKKNKPLFSSCGSSQPGREDRNGSKPSQSVDEVYAECQEKARKGALLLEGSETATLRRKFEP